MPPHDPIPCTFCNQIIYPTLINGQVYYFEDVKHFTRHTRNRCQFAQQERDSKEANLVEMQKKLDKVSQSVSKCMEKLGITEASS